MSQKAAYQKYKTSSIQSASREKILLMLYEGAIKFTKKAIIACEQKDIGERGLNIGRAFDIIMELNNTLDHKIGGSIAANLRRPDTPSTCSSAIMACFRSHRCGC